MAQVSINIPVENIAGMINSMDVKEIETLCLLLNDEGQELLRRKKEAEAEGFKFLSTYLGYFSACYSSAP